MMLVKYDVFLVIKGGNSNKNGITPFLFLFRNINMILNMF